MADRDLTLTDRVSRFWWRMPIPAKIAVIYALARVVTTSLFVFAGSFATTASRFGPHPNLGDLLVGWDGQWYWYVAVHGYPAVLPEVGSGDVAENQWAFLPLYPIIAQIVGLPFRSWPVGALLVSLVAGYLACLVLYRMLRLRLGRAASLWAVTFFASGPLAAIFQIAYAETLFLLWLFLALEAVMRRNYGRLFVLIPLMGFTRPGVLAFSLFLALFGVWRWWRRRVEPLGGREIAAIVSTGLLAAATGFAWPLIAAIVTGRPDAYLATELAWRRNWIVGATDELVPFDGFFQGAAFWSRTWGIDPLVGYMVLAVLLVGLAVLLIASPSVRKLGMELRLWSLAYAIYLLSVFFPQSSLFRLLLPLSPLWGAVAEPPSRTWRFGVLALCIVGQWWWIYNMYALGNTFWQVP